MSLIVKMCATCRVNFWADKKTRVCNQCKARGQKRRSAHE